MPPKIATIDTEGIFAELKSLNDKFATLVPIPDKLNKLEKLISSLTEENKQLRKEIERRDTTILTLKSRINHVEQHHRGWSIRVHNLPVPAEDETDTRKVMEIVYNKLFLPILTGAQTKGAITSIPSANQLIETAHPLAAKSGQAKPVIVRFHSRHERDLMFHYKKDFAPKENGPTSAARGNSRPPKLLFPFYEDLTGDTYKKLRELAQDDRVAGCWTVGGNIRFKKASDLTTVLRVRSVYDTNDSILA
jgi:FtsZ-binding cell division protein ZapB